MRVSIVVRCALGAVVLLALSLPTIPSQVSEAAPGPVVSVTGSSNNLKWKLTTLAKAHFVAASAGCSGSSGNCITIDPTKTLQPVDGFGAAMTDSSAYLLAGLKTTSPSLYTTWLNNLYGSPANGGLGLSFIRLPMGSSDYTHDGSEYTYDDLPAGVCGSDPNFPADFSIAHDTAYIIPTLADILALEQSQSLTDARILATPWSPPAWMKDPAAAGLTCSLDGGTLDPSNYAALAEYFALFINSYEAAGIPIWAVTPQDEPQFPTPTTKEHYPSMDWPTPGTDPGVNDEAGFIANQLGPTLQADSLLSTQILDYDQSYNTPDFPQAILSDTTANSYISGTAWHGYHGSPTEIAAFLQAFPVQTDYMTEHAGNPVGASQACGTAPWNTYYGACEYSQQLGVIMDALKNGAQGAMLWNIALDQNHGGYNAGTTDTGVGLIEVNNTNPASPVVTANPDYYALGQFSKYLEPGAVQIDTTQNNTGDGTAYDAVAFRNPDGTVVLVATDTSGKTGGEPLQVNWVNGATTETFTYQLAVDPTALGGFYYGKGYTFDWSAGTQTAVSPTGWTVSASTARGANSPSNVLDDNSTSRWTSGAPQTPGQWIQVDLGSVQTIDQVMMNSAGNPSDYPRGYQIQVSTDDSTWTQVGVGPPSGALITDSFPARPVRYIRITQTGTTRNWWSINSLSVYSSP